MGFITPDRAAAAVERARLRAEPPMPMHEVCALYEEWYRMRMSEPRIRGRAREIEIAQALMEAHLTLLERANDGA